MAVLYWNGPLHVDYDLKAIVSYKYNIERIKVEASMPKIKSILVDKISVPVLSVVFCNSNVSYKLWQIPLRMINKCIKSGF